jgi:hypothetical protein
MTRKRISSDVLEAAKFLLTPDHTLTNEDAARIGLRLKILGTALRKLGA